MGEGAHHLAHDLRVKVCGVARGVSSGHAGKTRRERSTYSPSCTPPAPGAAGAPDSTPSRSPCDPDVSNESFADDLPIGAVQTDMMATSSSVSMVEWTLSGSSQLYGANAASATDNAVELAGEGLWSGRARRTLGRRLRRCRAADHARAERREQRAGKEGGHRECVGVEMSRKRRVVGGLAAECRMAIVGRMGPVGPNCSREGLDCASFFFDWASVVG